VLDRVAYQIEKETQIKRRVKGAMMYPTMVLIFATLVLIGLLMFLVPVFVNIFAQLDGELPKLTQIVVAASNQLRHHWFIIFPALAARSGASARQAHRDRPRLWDRIKLKIPMKIGDVVLKVTMARFSRTALDARRGRRRHHQGARDHRPDRRQLGRSRKRSRASAEGAQGVPIAQPLIENPVFPPMVSQMVKIGEETGELEKMLGRSRTSTRTRSTPRSAR
jgi:type IV pilus assembly protein PilC